MDDCYTAGNRQRHAALNIALLLVLSFSLFLNGCGKSPASRTAALPQGITGVLETGKPAVALTAPISSSGGSARVTDAASPIAGLEIKIPANAYNSTVQYQISSAPVEKHSFGPDFNPLTPLISVQNGGNYADDIIEVKVPVKVPEDQFAMGFLYDEETHTLEGLPMVAEDENSITVATRHFSKFVIAATTKQELLRGDFDSGFRPGVDDLEFVNWGSIIAPDGHCSGQSMTALWYFTQKPDGKDVSLWGRYDNNGRQPATPGIWQDDSLLYRFCSTVQVEERWKNPSRRITIKLSHQPERTFLMFAYAMRLTNEPQMVEIWNADNSSGHAIVVYRIKQGNLYVADPNYPGKTDRQIVYNRASASFSPYNSGNNSRSIAAGEEISYTRVVYIGKTPMLDWVKMSQRWKELKDGTVGKDMFPAYEILQVDDKKVESKLNDGYVSGEKVINLKVSSPTANVTFHVYRDGVVVPPATGSPATGTMGFTLKPGNNLLGIFVTSANEDYVDFKYLNIEYKEPAPTPAPVPQPVPVKPAATPNQSKALWVLADTKLPAIPQQPITWSDQYGDNSMTITITGKEIVSKVVTSKQGKEVGTSTMTAKFDKVPGELTELDQFAWPVSWVITGTGIPRYTSTYVEVRSGEFDGKTQTIKLEENPAGTLVFNLIPPTVKSGTFEVSAKLSVRGDFAKVVWMYKPK